MPDADLQKVSQSVESISLDSGEILFKEGSPGEKAYVIHQGEIEISKASNGRDVLLAVRGPGTLLGEMALLESTPRTATIKARSDCQLFVISRESLDRVLHSSPTAMASIFKTILNRLRDNQQQLQQSEKMALLGTFTAGIAHELNNPAAAMQRGAIQLREAQIRMSESFIELLNLNLDESQMNHLNELSNHVKQQAGLPVELDALIRSDKEEMLEVLLEDLGIQDAWEHTATLVDLGIDEKFLSVLSENFKGIPIRVIVEWLRNQHESYTLLNEIAGGGERVSEIVSALKSYSFHDQAPVLNVDVNKGLDDTLIILHHRMKSGISVTKDYADDLPQIMAYGSELNQVWTNIIDNAIQAMEATESAQIIIRTGREGDWVRVEIEDNGPGIPAENQPKIFDSFFTTKEPGKGTGLGLNISYNIIQKHHGDITVASVPGKTCFRVLLPLNLNNK
ncbi:MAG: cyclic nucleotide-binding domain-containing protein [FCB group bacterium]|nr:cyclic nucleotide-binding domain-containing protein [FCB group bacterium]